MNGGTPRSVMSESNQPNDPQRRRSPRLSSATPLQANLKTDNKMAPASVAVKRRITVRKIAPRKTTAPSEYNKENTPRQSEENQQKVSTPSPTPDSSVKKKKAAMPSPILASSPPPSRSQEPDPDVALWSQKVRRSYSRLSDQSLNSPDSRETLFGFEKLQTPEVGQRVRHCKTGLEASRSFAGLNSFTSMLEADDEASAQPEPDRNIPGVVVEKEKRRRRKVQHIATLEMDALAAEMNAVFEDAEDFELVVE